MKNHRSAAIFACLLSLSLGACQATHVKPTAGIFQFSTTPYPRIDNQGHLPEWWRQRHESFNARMAEPAKVLFIGDSITHGWDSGGRAIWDEYFAPLGAVNLGISADRTEHVLWRLQNGNLETPIAPEVAVIMIGTNNTGQRGDSPEHIRDGVKAIIGELHKRFPDMEILLLAIFPRGATPEDAGRMNNRAANHLLAELGDSRLIHFININHVFLDENGRLPESIMPDLLHPNAEGYQLWADALIPHLQTALEN